MTERVGRQTASPQELPQPRPPLVLVVTFGERAIERLFREDLSKEGFMVLTKSVPPNESGDLGEFLANESPDIAIVPVMGVFDVLQELKLFGVPYIVYDLERKTSKAVSSLEMGADHYVGFPLDTEELAAHMRAILRRTQSKVEPERIERVDGLDIDLKKGIVKKEGRIIPVSEIEWRVLELLVENRGRVMLPAELLYKAFGPEYRDDIQYLRKWIGKLRKKLENDPKEPKLIKTVIGIGYRFVGRDPESLRPRSGRASSG